MDALEWQARSQYRGEPLEHPEMTWRFGIRNRAQDRDNIKTTLLDVMVAAGVLANDNFMHCDGRETTEPSVRVGKGEPTWVEIELT